MYIVHTWIGREADNENCTWANAIFKHSGLIRVKKKAIVSVRVFYSTILRGPYRTTFERPKMTNRFEIDGLAARQERCHFANVYHVTLDTRPTLVFFLQ